MFSFHGLVLVTSSFRFVYQKGIKTLESQNYWVHNVTDINFIHLKYINYLKGPVWYVMHIQSY